MAKRTATPKPAPDADTTTTAPEPTDTPASADAASLGFHGAIAAPVDGDPNTILTVTEAAPADTDQPGYLGTLPDADNRPDLTLAGVLKRDHPDAATGDTGQSVQG